MKKALACAIERPMEQSQESSGLGGQDFLRVLVDVAKNGDAVINCLDVCHSEVRFQVKRHR